MNSFWIIGAGGLLGSAITRSLRHRQREVRIHSTAGLPWDSDEELSAAASSIAKDLIATNVNWTVVWAAGAAVTGSTRASLDHEFQQLRIVLDAIRAVCTEYPGRGISRFFYASSAGALYAGSADPPFDEFTTPVPISEYGRFKLRAEALVEEFARQTGTNALIGRIANLYGPGQQLEKTQGLISHLARAQLSPAPARIFVPLDTLRDYIFVDDAAELIVDALQILGTVNAAGYAIVVKNIASGTASTIADLLGYLRLISKGRPNVMLGRSPLAELQAHDLRIGTRVWPELDARDFTPLPVGIHLTIHDLLRRIQNGAGANAPTDRPRAGVVSGRYDAKPDK